MSEKPILEQDGIQVVPSEKFQTYVTRVYKSGNQCSFVVTVPVEIARALNLTHQSIVQVAIQQVTPEYAKAEFGYVQLRVPRSEQAKKKDEQRKRLREFSIAKEQRRRKREEKCKAKEHLEWEKRKEKHEEASRINEEAARISAAKQWKAERGL